MDAKLEAKQLNNANAVHDRQKYLDWLALSKTNGLVECLPRGAKELIALIGIEAAMKLVQEEGGNEIRLPEVIDGSSIIWARLVETIGHDAATRLVRDWPDTRIYVPMCQSISRFLRILDVKRRYDSGEPLESIRRSHGVTRSYLYRLLKKSN